MKRRHLLAAVGGTAGASALFGTGAFTAITAERTAIVDVVGDAEQPLRLTPTDGPNGEYADFEGGTLTIDLTGDNGVGADAATRMDRVFSIANHGTRPVRIWIEDRETTEENNVVFYRGTPGSGSALPADSELADIEVGWPKEYLAEFRLDSPERAVTLAPGESVEVGLAIATVGESPGDRLLDSILVHAVATEGEPPGEIPEEATFELELEESGPFTAGETARVVVTAQDADGEPLPGLPLRAFQYSGRDTVDSLAVQDRGGGEYLVEVAATLAGEVGVEVTGPAEGVAPMNLPKRLPIQFEPADVDRFRVEDVESVPAPDSAGGPGGDLAGSFSLAFKDRFGNVVSPSNGGSFDLSADSDNVTLSREVDQERGIIDVTATFDETPSPDRQTPENGWGSIRVTVEETEVVEESKTATLQFPFVHFEQRARRVDGDVRNTIRFYSLDFTPLTDYELVVPIDPQKVDSVTNPDPNNGFSEPVVETVDEGIQITPQDRRPTEGIEEPTTEFVQLNLSQELLNDELTDLSPRIEPNFEGFEPIPPLIPEIPVKLLLARTICLKIWMGPGTSTSRVNQDIKEMKDVFSRSVKNCCPIVFFDIEKETITRQEWNAVDNDGDGRFDSWNGRRTKTVSDGMGNRIEVPDLTSEEQALFNNHHKSGCVNAYYLPDLSPGLQGLAYGEVTGSGQKWTYDTNGKRDSDACLLSNADPAGDNKVLVHELGHVLGELQDFRPSQLPHGSDNIQTDATSPSTAGHWNPEQCEEISDLEPRPITRH